MATAASSILVVEDGTLVAGANTLCTPTQAAAYHLSHGNSLLAQRLESSNITFAANGVVTLPTGALTADLPAVVRFTGAAEAGNTGWGYAVAGAGDDVLVSWLTTETEAAGAAVVLDVFAQSGWWADTLWRLEASLVRATVWVTHRYDWAGTRLGTLAWPRDDVSALYTGRYYDVGDLIASDVIPEGVPEAVAAWALVDLSEDLFRHVPRDERPLVSKTIPGVIAKTWAAGRGDAAGQAPEAPLADAEVAGLYWTNQDQPVAHARRWA